VETQSSVAVVSISGDQGRRSILFFCLRVWMPSLRSLPEKILVSHHKLLISRHACYFVYSQQGRSSVLRSLRSRPTQQKTKTPDDDDTEDNDTAQKDTILSDPHRLRF